MADSVAPSPTRVSLHGNWSSRFAFILAVTGSAVGLGNIWGFPYMTGQNGGGLFVLVYLVCVALVGLPIMMGEIFIGRTAQNSPVGAYRTLSKPASPSRVVNCSSAGTGSRSA